MSAEDLKLAISVLSALLAVFSTVVAVRTKRQTRLDLFETQRDLLLLAAAENDAKLAAIDARAQLLLKQIEKSASTSHDTTRMLVEPVVDLRNVVRGLRTRDWTEASVRGLQYSEESLLNMRKLALQEQVLSKTIQAEAHDLLLSHVQKALDGQDRAA